MSWEKVRLEEVCKIVGGTTPSTSKAEFWNGDIIWLSPVDLPEVGSISIVKDSLRKITSEAVKSSSLEILPINSIVFSTRASIGKIGIVKKPLCTNQGFTNLIPREKIYYKYLAYALKHNIQNISRLGNSTTFNEISRTAFKNFQIPLPPLATQKRIAEILDAADALKRKDQELLKKYDELAQAIFIDMFGDPVKNEKGWDLKTIDEVAIKVTDGDHLTPIRSQRGYKLLSCRNVKNGYIDFEAGLDFVEEDEFNRMYKRCNPEKGDILVSCSGTIGRVTQIKIDEKFVLVRSAALIKPDYRFIVSTYFEYYLQTDFMQREMYKSSNTSSQANLFTGPIKALPVLLPSKNLQEKFAAKIQLLEKAKNMALSNNISTSNLFDSLIQKAFKGELVA